jgi:DNA-binding SARP family transcriptional activator
MVVKVLGPLDTGGEALSPRERAILAALVVRLGSAVDPDELAVAVWGDDPPPTWEQQIRNSIARIRRRMGRETVQTVGAEYRLGLDPDSIDAVRFERLVSTARGHALRSEHDRAVDAYRRALAMWRGKPLQDVRDWEPAIVEVLRLESIRQAAEEELLESRLETGEAASVIPDAERLVRDDPLRESRWAVLALANYRSDRQSDALATLREARRRLDDELGIEPSARLAELERAILRREPGLDAVAALNPASSECPYPGLRAFRPEEAELFFGRDQDIDVVLEMLGRYPVVTIAGPSGTGKSSLLLAGVVPRLRDRGRHVDVIRPTSETADEMTRSAERAGVIAIDQAEELQHLHGDVIAELAGALRTVAGANCSLLLTVRSDALDALRALPSIGDLLGTGICLLGPLSEASLREAIIEPAGRAGLRLEPGLVELVVRDAGDRAATLPHLSHALRETWIRREGSTLTVEGYRTSGGIAGAIAQSAEEVVATLSPHEREICRSLLLRLIDRDADGSSTRRRIPTELLASDEERRLILDRLVAARLVTIDDQTATIAHEAVARAWPRLDAWLEESAESIRTMRAVESAALAWEAGGRSDDDLPRGARLHAISAWRPASASDLTALEVEYIERALAGEAARAAADRAAAARDRQQNRRLRWALGGAAALLVVALAAGGLAVVRGADAATAAEQEQIEALAATSLSMRDSDPYVAALLAAEIAQRWPGDSRTRSAMLGNVSGAGGLVSRTVFDADRVSAAAVPGTPTALVVLDTFADESNPQPGGEVLLVDVDSGRRIASLEADLPRFTLSDRWNITISPDGRLAVLQVATWHLTRDDRRTCCANWLTFLDLTARRQIGENVLVESRMTDQAVFSEDGTRVYFAHSVTGDPIVADPVTGEVTFAVPQDPDDWADLEAVVGAVGLDGAGVLVGHPTELVRHDPVTLAVTDRLPLASPDHANSAVLPLPDGGVFISGWAGMARLDADGAQLWRADPPDLCEEAIVASADTILCKSWNGSVITYDLGSGAPTGRHFDARSDWTFGLDPVGEREFLVFTARSPTAMQLWRLDASAPITTVIAQGRVVTDGFGAEGRLIATAPAPRSDEGGNWRLWDVDADAPVGAEFDGIVWLTEDLFWIWDGEGRIHSVSTGDVVTMDRAATGDDYRIWSGGHGGHAFFSNRAGTTAFDPGTGRPTSDPFGPALSDLGWFQSVTELTGTGRAAITWWDDDARQTITAVYDIETGEELFRGGAGDVHSISTAEGDLVSASAASLTRSSADLEPFYALAKSGAGPRWMQTTVDDRTLLLAGFDDSVSLYDLRDGRKLGFEIPTDATGMYDAAAGYISADGQRMVTTASDGILLWDLSPHRMHEAVCRIAGRELTPLEWSTYFGDEPQTPTCDDVFG